MSVFEQLQSASYKGIRFLVRTEDTTEGPKIAVHEYVNSDQRFVETLGDLPAIFRVSIIIHGDDMLARRDALRTKLKQGTPGELVLPVIGSVNVANGSYTMRTEDAKVGRVVFEVTFYTDTGAAFPTQIAANQSSVGRKGDEVRNKTDQAITDGIVVPTTGASQDALETKINSVGTTLQSVMQTLSGVEQDIATVTTAINSLIQDAASIARTPAILADRINTVFSTVRGLEMSIEGALTLSSFGIDDPFVAPITVDRQNRINNNNLINEVIQVNGTVTAYEQAAASTFDNNEQLESTISDLDVAFKAVVLSASNLLQTDIVDDSAILVTPESLNIQNFNTDVDLFDSFNDVRTTSLAVLAQKEGANFRVVTRELAITGVNLLSYQLYGSLDNVKALSDLNYPDFNISHLVGPVKVFEVDQ